MPLSEPSKASKLLAACGAIVFTFIWASVTNLVPWEIYLSPDCIGPECLAGKAKAALVYSVLKLIPAIGFPYFIVYRRRRATVALVALYISLVTPFYFLQVYHVWWTVLY